MDYAAWRDRLDAQRGGAVAWRASTSPPARRVAIARLLRAYAESESAEGMVADLLLSRATCEDDRAALRLLLADEERHAEILIEAAARLDPEHRTVREGSSGGLRRLVWIARPLGLLETLVVFHLLEIAAVSVYRILRATNRHDPLVRGALGLVLRDEAAHVAFHEQRLAEVAETSRMRRLGLSLVHRAAARLIVKNDRAVAPPGVYPLATGLSFERFNARVIRSYEIAYSGRLAYLREDPARHR
jgi:hypothetical protein